MEKITAYKTEDGKVFKTEHEAVFHELKINLYRSFDNESAYEKMGFDEVLSWIENNQTDVKQFLELL